MSGESAPGPDGFPGLFFTTCWHIIGDDVTAAVMEFFATCTLPRSYSSTFLVMIPKKDQPETLSDFRPISLCNFAYKIIALIFSDRLGLILPYLISPQQGAFVKGRSLIENVGLAQEIFHDLPRKVRGGNVVIKLDMAKAYDRLEWDFLFAVLERFGFSPDWISYIRTMFTNCWFSVMLNGVVGGFFKSSRGLRQGDPLAPSLFILAEEVLSRGLYYLMSTRAIHPFHSPRGCPLISHLLFADDTVILTNGDARSLSALMKFLSSYECSSGQRVNKHKSGFIVAASTPTTRINMIHQKTGLKHQVPPIPYTTAC